jgi:hypothetical protein
MCAHLGKQPRLGTYPCDGLREAAFLAKPEADKRVGPILGAAIRLDCDLGDLNAVALAAIFILGATFLRATLSSEAETGSA